YDEVAEHEDPDALLTRETARAILATGLRHVVLHAATACTVAVERAWVPSAFSTSAVFTRIQTTNTTSGTQNTKNPFHAKGPVLKSACTVPGMKRTATQKLK